MHKLLIHVLQIMVGRKLENISKVKTNTKPKITSNDDKGVGVEVDNIWK